MYCYIYFWILNYLNLFKFNRNRAHLYVKIFDLSSFVFENIWFELIVIWKWNWFQNIGLIWKQKSNISLVPVKPKNIFNIKLETIRHQYNYFSATWVIWNINFSLWNSFSFNFNNFRYQIQYWLTSNLLLIKYHIIQS